MMRKIASFGISSVDSSCAANKVLEVKGLEELATMSVCR
jgi:hypothetical protein